MADLATLVAIPSVEDMDGAREGAPYGPEAARALEAALGIAQRLGFEPHNLEGHVGYADAVAAESREPRKQLGIIGHVDVVPTGPGWTVDPWTLTRREGYVLGRGVLDDKGPLLVAMHALAAVRAFAADHAADPAYPEFAGGSLPFDTRIIVGCNEETFMRDVDYYQAHVADPDFLFTPDAEFPVGYGEKGIYQAELLSAPQPADQMGLEEIAGGSAVNAVPGEASALVRRVGRMTAEGRTAHASKPYEGESAILRLIAGLLDGFPSTMLTETERNFLDMVARVTGSFDGSGAGLAAEDGDFGPLTLVGGKISLKDAGEEAPGAKCLVQTIDIRYPLTITAPEITARLEAAAEEVGATLRIIKVEPPYLTSADTPEVQALLAAYQGITGDREHGAFTMGGGTYARHFSRAASFGLEMPWVEQPAWVGTMHGADEGVSEEQLRTAFKVYATAIRNMAKLWR